MKYRVSYPSGHEFEISGKLSIVNVAGHESPFVELDKAIIYSNQHCPIGSVMALDPRAVVLNLETGEIEFSGIDTAIEWAK